MLALSLLTQVAPWAGFIAFVLLALSLDLGVFHKQSREVRFSEAVFWTVVWFLSALVFGFLVAPRLIPDWTAATSGDFFAGYLVELSLSMDNVFVIALIFTYFGVPQRWQHRVLFWGVLWALVLRATFILVGTSLFHHFKWPAYAFGAFLAYSGFKLLLARGDEEEPDLACNPVVRLMRRFFPICQEFDEDRFTSFERGKRILTPLAVVLAVVETTDVVFAVDSIPAVFGITTHPLVVFTSNIFAIMGLRSLYFVLVRAIGYFKYLKPAMALVLVVIGLKMLAAHWLQKWLGDELRNWSLGLVFGLLILAILASVFAGMRDRMRNRKDESGR